jgi:hypothetical protein
VNSAAAQGESQATQQGSAPLLPLFIPKRLAWLDQTLSPESLRRLESQSMFPPRPSQLPHPPLPTAAPHVSADVAESMSFEQPEPPKPAAGPIVSVSMKRDATGKVSVSLKRVVPAAPAAPLEQIEKHSCVELSPAHVAPAAPAAPLEEVEKHGYGLPHLPPETNYEQLHNLGLAVEKLAMKAKTLAMKAETVIVEEKEKDAFSVKQITKLSDEIPTGGLLSLLLLYFYIYLFTIC